MSVPLGRCASVFQVYAIIVCPRMVMEEGHANTNKLNIALCLDSQAAFKANTAQRKISRLGPGVPGADEAACHAPQMG